jgi:hypothetical protein
VDRDWPIARFFVFTHSSVRLRLESLLRPLPSNPTVMAIQENPQNCIQAHSHALSVLQHIIKNNSERQRQSITPRDPQVTVKKVCFSIVKERTFPVFRRRGKEGKDRALKGTVAP